MQNKGHMISDVLRCVMLRALLRAQVWRDGRDNPASHQFTCTFFHLRYHGLSESFLEEILPAKGFVWDFFRKRFDARLKYFEKLHNLMNLVVKVDLGSGGCRKLFG